MQCILNCPRFADEFERATHVDSGKFGLARAFAALVKEVRSKSASYVTPQGVKTSVANKSRIFAGYGQQDAHEFLIQFLEAVSIDLNRVNTKPKYVELDYHNNRTKQQNVNTDSNKVGRLV